MSPLALSAISTMRINTFSAIHGRRGLFEQVPVFSGLRRVEVVVFNIDSSEECLKDLEERLKKTNDAALEVVFLRRS